MGVVDEEYRLYYHNSAKLACKMGRYDLELLAWQNALHLDPYDSLAQRRLERCLRERADLLEMIAEAEQQLAETPEDVKTRHYLAHHYFSEGRIAEAKAQWEQVAAIETENWSKHARKMIRKHCWSVE
jgi:tetratricopeptide (TPR) repeat protein